MLTDQPLSAPRQGRATISFAQKQLSAAFDVLIRINYCLLRSFVIFSKRMLLLENATANLTLSFVLQKNVIVGSKEFLHFAYCSTFLCIMFLFTQNRKSSITCLLFMIEREKRIELGFHPHTLRTKRCCMDTTVSTTSHRYPVRLLFFRINSRRQLFYELLSVISTLFCPFLLSPSIPIILKACNAQTKLPVLWASMRGSQHTPPLPFSCSSIIPS